MGSCAGHPMDGYHHESRTVFQFHGCHFHGYPKCLPERGHFFQEKGKNVTTEEVYQRTFRRNEVIIQAGYNLIVR